MKKLLLFFFAVFLVAKDYYMVLGEPLISSSTSDIVKDSIYLGYYTQIDDLKDRIKESKKSFFFSDNIFMKFMGDNVQAANDSKILKFLLKADRRAQKELDEFIKLVHKNIVLKENRKLSLKKISLKGKISFDFKISNRVRTNKIKFLEDNFKSVIERLKSIYGVDKFLMPFYTYDKSHNIVIDYKLHKPDLFFYEYYFPEKRGRRYFLKIFIYVISVDSDGKVSLEYEKIDDFNWRRNYRFIAAQTGYVVRELIKNKLKVDIR